MQSALPTMADFSQAIRKDPRSFDPELLMRTTSWADVVASAASTSTSASTSWASVVAAAAAAAQGGAHLSIRDLLVPRHMGANTSSVLCCSKQPDSDRIPWEQCTPGDIMAVNYTALAAAAG